MDRWQKSASYEDPNHALKRISGTLDAVFATMLGQAGGWANAKWSNIERRSKTPSHQKALAKHIAETLRETKSVKAVDE